MIENMIVIAVVAGVALLALRSLYRTFSGRSSGCACGGKGCAEGGAGPEVGAHSCQSHKDGGCQCRTGQHLLSDIGRLPAGRLHSGTTARF